MKIWAWVPYSRAVLWCRSLFQWRWHLGLDLDHYFYFLWHLGSKGLAWRWVAPKELRRPKQAFTTDWTWHLGASDEQSCTSDWQNRSKETLIYLILIILGSCSLGSCSGILSVSSSLGITVAFLFSKGKCESCFLPARGSTEVLVKHVQCSVVSICQVKWKIQVLFTFGYSCLSIIFLYCNCLLWLPNSQTTQKRSLAKDGSGVLQEC